MKKTEIRSIRENIPIIGYDKDIKCFISEDGSYLNIYQIQSKDLVSSDVDDIEMDCFKWAKFYKTYGMDVEIISLMFPCDTGAQQKYWKRRLESNQNPMFTKMINRKIEELVWREKHTASKEFYLVFFFPDKDAIAENVKTIESTLEIDGTGLIKTISDKKKELILFKLANKNSLIF